MQLASHTGNCVRRRRSTRRPSTILAHRAARAYPVAVPFLVSPPFHPRPRAHAELGRAELAAVRSADHPSPLRLDSPRPEPSSLAVHRLHSTPCPFEPNPGRNRGPDRAAIAVLLRSSASPSNSLLRPSYARNRASVSFPAPPSTSLTFSPPKSGAAAAGSPSRRRGRSARRARTPPTALRGPRGPRPRAPQPPALADRAPAA